MKKETINIDVRKQTFKAKLRGIAFSEGDFRVIYIPSLQISAYGETTKEAHEMVKVSLHNFSKNMFELDEAKIHSILNKLGWERKQYFKKRLINLSETTFDDIKKEFNLPDNTQVEQIPIAV